MSTAGGDIVGVIITAIVIFLSLFAEKKKKKPKTTKTTSADRSTPPAAPAARREVPAAAPSSDSFEEIFETLFKEKGKKKTETSFPERPPFPSEKESEAPVVVAATQPSARRTLDKLSQREKDAETAFRFDDYSVQPKSTSTRSEGRLEDAPKGTFGYAEVSLGDIDVELGDIGEGTALSSPYKEKKMHPRFFPPMARAVILHEVLSPPVAFRRRSFPPVSYLNSDRGK